MIPQESQSNLQPYIGIAGPMYYWSIKLIKLHVHGSMAYQDKKKEAWDFQKTTIT